MSTKDPAIEALETIVALRDGYKGEDMGRVSGYRVAGDIAEAALRKVRDEKFTTTSRRRAETMVTPTIRIDATEFMQLAQHYKGAPKRVERGFISGINKIGDQVMTQVRKDLRKQTGIGDRDTRRSKGLFKKLARPESPDFFIVARSQWTPLSYFRPSQRNAGVAARPWNNPQFFRGAFIATMPSGYRGVFVRVKKDSKRKNYRNAITGRMQGGHLPIRTLWGPSLATELLRDPIPSNFQRKVEEVAHRVINHEVLRALTPRTRKTGRPL